MVDGEVVGRATVECPEQRDGRQITTEVWQLDNNTWRRIDASATEWDESWRVLPRHRPDTTGIDCQTLDGPQGRQYQTRVVVANAAGATAVATSDVANLLVDCLAQSGDYKIFTTQADATAAGVSGGRLVTCRVTFGTPTRTPQDRVQTYGDFNCERDAGYTRYLRVLLVERTTPFGWGKIHRNRGFVETTGNARSFRLYAACRVNSNQRTTYYTIAREVREDNYTGRQDKQTLDSFTTDVNGRC